MAIGREHEGDGYKGLKAGRLTVLIYSDVLHPNRANVSKDDLRGKLAELYKCTKEQVNVFGLQTQFGGGKTTGFALVYDSPEALAKFEPHFRLVRIGVASKIEKPSRQQRTLQSEKPRGAYYTYKEDRYTDSFHRQAAQEPPEDPPRNGQGQRPKEEEEPGLNLAHFLTEFAWAWLRWALIGSGIQQSTMRIALVLLCGGSRD